MKNHLSRKGKIMLDCLQILLAILLICTLFIPYMTLNTKLNNGNLSMINFIGKIFNGEIANVWAIISVIIYFIILLYALLVIVLSICNICKKKVKYSSKFMGILLLVLVGIFLLSSIVYASTNTETIIIGKVIYLADLTSLSISWSPIACVACGVFLYITKFLER